MAHESFEDPGDRRADERAVRQHQGRPRGAAGSGQDLPGRPAVDHAAPRRLAAHHVPVAGRPAALLRRHLLPQGAAPRAARASASCCGASPSITTATAQRSAGRASSWLGLRAAGAGRAARPRALSTRRRSGGPRGPRAAAFDTRFGGFSPAPKFPHAGSIERCLRHWHLPARQRPDLQGAVHGDPDPDANGRGRHLRPARRRLLPLLRRCPRG